MSAPTYEPRVILEHAERLNRKAESMGITSAAIGGVIGGCLGAVPLTSLGAAWPIPAQFGFGTLLVGLLIGALAGYVIGDARAFGYRLQAQSSLCQLQLEQNTATLLATSYSDGRYPAAPAVAPRVEFAERLEYSEPRPAPVVEAPVAELFEPEPWPEPAPLVEVPRFEPPAAPQPEPEPVCEPAPAALVEVPPPVAPVAPVAPAPPVAAAPEPAPASWQSEVAPWPAEQPLPDLATLSLEEIARLAKSGLI